MAIILRVVNHLKGSTTVESALGIGNKKRGEISRPFSLS
jgi:hypothetical protein